MRYRLHVFKESPLKCDSSDGYCFQLIYSAEQKASEHDDEPKKEDSFSLNARQALRTSIFWRMWMTQVLERELMVL